MVFLFSLQNTEKLRLQGFSQFKWQRRKFFQQMRSRGSEWIKKCELWRGSLKIIEGNFGTGVVAYFLFLRWLLFLNLFIFTIILIVVITPQIVLKEPRDIPCALTNATSVQCCSEKYLNGDGDGANESFAILDLIQGTGFMERTILFYGMYTNKIFGTEGHMDDVLMEVEEESSVEPEENTDGITNFVYNLPLAYLCSAIVFFSMSIFAIVRSASKEFKDRLVEGEGQFYQYCNLIFGGWDFCIDNEKSATIKHKALFNEIVGLLQSKKIEARRRERSREVMLKLIGVRILINILTLLILAGACVTIYFLFNASMAYLDPNFPNQNTEYLTKFKEKYGGGKRSQVTTATTTNSIPLPLLMYSNRGGGLEDYNAMDTQETEYLHFNANPTEGAGYAASTPVERETRNGRFIGALAKKSLFVRSGVGDLSFKDQLNILFYEYLPYLFIVSMNLFVPLLFNYLVKYEQYTPLFVIKVTLLRTVVLRLASLAVLLSRFYFIISPKEALPEDKCYNTDRATPQCWETFIGQQFYKLLIVDFVTQIFVTFFVNFPRSMFAKHSDRKFAKWIGEQEFELPRHVLDVVYSQTICWLGCFYSPVLPGIAVILNYLMFYVKKFACLVNSRPSAILYRASRSNSLFMFILLLSFVAAIVPIVYSIVEIMPSKSCGPFRGLSSVWEQAVITFLKTPTIIQNLVFFLGTAGFAIPCFVVLLLFLYYYVTVAGANKHMVEVLKNQLILEGHDKQFLLNRLSAFMRQHHEFQKKMRLMDMERNRAMDLDGTLPPPPPPPVSRADKPDRNSASARSRD